MKEITEEQINRAAELDNDDEIQQNCFYSGAKWMQKEMQPDNEKTSNSDTEKCTKCNGRTALVSGEYYWNADQEPYSNGKQEVAENREGTSWIHGYVCDDCGSIQGLWNED